MIISLQRFIDEEKKYWAQLESLLDKLDRDPFRKMDLSEIKRFHNLYHRTSSDLARVMGFSAETEIRRYLESLVGHAYAQVHEIRGKSRDFSILRWFFEVFPQTFRRHIRAFVLSLGITAFGFVIGGMAISIDKEAKSVILPFSHLQIDPSKRVAYEEKTGAAKDHLAGKKVTFSAFLMTHNTRVSLFTFAMGFTWGIGTVILLFYNGIILGAVVLDFIHAGQSTFLVGWLLPHGAVEIPAIVLAGQAGFILAGALIGWGQRISLKTRLRTVAPELMTLLCGLAIMLIWAGVVEAFFSQYHEPVIPYGAKIVFGVMELIALILFFGLSGKPKEQPRGEV
ncbi:MAG TPA: stage II sporulation protein M [Thermodesulfobacteriota bacterium]|nr:stage II sporulation protein M [Thermodesulfobacteriota bacterium]